MDCLGKAVSSHLCWVDSTCDVGSVEPGFPTLQAPGSPKRFGDHPRCLNDAWGEGGVKEGVCVCDTIWVGRRNSGGP